jgi:hypothetical protein
MTTIFSRGVTREELATAGLGGATSNGDVRGGVGGLGGYGASFYFAFLGGEGAGFGVGFVAAGTGFGNGEKGDASRAGDASDDFGLVN